MHEDNEAACAKAERFLTKIICTMYDDALNECTNTLNMNT